MKIAFNPSTVAALTSPPDNKDITFDLRGHNIFARGVKFYGTDTNTWRDIKINNVSISSNILDLRNGSNTTLTNTNGVVTINSTWRPVVDNLTSDSTTSSLSANQGRVLAGLINGKSDSDHNHDDRYVKRSGDTMIGALNFANGTWNKMGDDIYIGDYNIGGQLCLMGITGNTGISFHKQGDASIRKSITFNGSTLYMNGSCDYASLANQSNLLAMNTVPNKTTSTSVGSWSPISGRYVFHQKWTDTSTGGDTADFGIYLDGNLTANMVLDGYYNSLLGFRVMGASGGFLKANGTIDNSTYLTSHQSLSNYYTKGEIDTKLNSKLNYRLFWERTNIDLNSITEAWHTYEVNDGTGTANTPTNASWHQAVQWGTGDTNYAIQLCTAYTSNYSLYLRHKIAGKWYNWIQLAAISDIPSSLKNPHSFNVFGVTYDGSAARTVTTSNFISQLEEGTSVVTDGTMLITSYASNSGFADTNAVNIPYKRKAVRLWDYIKTKTDTLYSALGHNHDGRYVRYYAVTTLDCNNLASGLTSARVSATNAAHTNHSAYLYISDIGTPFQIQIPDSSVPYIYKRYHDSGGGWSEWFKLNAGYADSAGSASRLEGGSIPNWGTLTAANGFTNVSSWDYGSRGAFGLCGKNNILYMQLDGFFYQNEGRYRVLDTSDVASLKNDLTVHQYLSATANTWYPLIWGGSSHANTNDSTGAVYKSHDKLSWQTSSQTLYATRFRTSSISIDQATGVNSNGTKTHPFSGITGTCADNDFWRIGGGGINTNATTSSSNNGYLEIATSDDGNEPIYIRQYTGTFGTIKRTLTLLDANGFSYFPSYINIGGNENNNSSPDRVWGSNSSDSYLRSYRTSALSVANADTTDGVHLEWSGELGANDYSWLAGWTNDGKKIKAVNKNHFATSGHNHDGRYAVSENYGGFTRTDRLPISGFYQSVESESGGNAPWKSWMHLINCQHSNTNNNYALQIAASFYDNNTFKIRVTNGSVNNAWRDIIHSGNISSQSVASASNAGNADTVDGYHASHLLVKRGRLGAYNIDHETTFGTRDIQPESEVTISGKRPFNGWGTLLVIGSIDGASNQQLAFTGNNRMFIRCAYGTSNNYNTKDWATVALTSDNVASATKLQTPRTIWGQSFDGTGNVSGNLSKVGNIQFSADNSYSIGTTTSEAAHTYTRQVWARHLNASRVYAGDTNLYIGYSNTANVKFFSGTKQSGDGSNERMTISTNGNVGIGINNPAYKLDVNGQMRTSGFRHSSVNSDNYILLAGGGYKSFGGDDSNPIFLGYLNLDHGNDGTISSSFSCLGYSVPFTYTRGGNYCRINIPDTTHQVFYIKAAIASVNYSGGGMDTWVGYHRGTGSWWLHCYASGTNEVRVKGFRQANDSNDSWWGGNPLWSGNDGANKITVCIFGYVKFR